MIQDNSSEDMGSASRQRSTSRLASYRPYLNSQQRQKSHDEYAIGGYRNVHNHWQPQDGDLRMIAQMSKVHLRRFHKANVRFPPVFTQSFDAEHRSSTESQSGGGATGPGGEGRWSNLVLHHIPDRRSSFLYRHESDDNPSVYSSRHASITGEEVPFDSFIHLVGTIFLIRTNFDFNFSIQPRLSTLGKHWRTQEPPVTVPITRSNIIKTAKEKAKDSQEDAVTSEPSGQFDTEGDGSESECSKDRLGQLPLSTRHGMGRFRVADSKMTSDLTNQTNRPFTFSELSLNPDSRRPTNRGSAGVRRGSLCIFSHVDEPIVTPFAQILASLRRVRSNFIILTNVSSSKDSRFGTCHTNLSDDLSPMLAGSYDHLKSTASETLEELEWCLERLENIQTHRSVSDMATSKFRKMLSKELSQITEGGQSSKQISEYICSTFLEPKEGDTGGGLTQGYDSSTEDKPIATSHEQLATNMSGTLDTSTECDSSSDRHNHLHTIRSSTGPVASTNVRESPLTLGSQNKTADGSDAVSTIPSYLLPYGVKSDQPQKLQRLISNDLDLWGLDIFELAQVTPNPLTCVFCSILQKRGLIKRFSISEMNLVRYMNLVEENYRNVPYHNRVHAADVVQSTHVLLNAQALTTVFTELEVLAILFACAVHDVDHPGLTNQYLINTNDQLAILYNDSSVLENHHLAIAFQLLTRPGCDLFENIPKKQRLSLRRMAIDMVLATDMSKHMSLLADLKTMVETKKVAGSGILTLDNYSDRMQVSFIDYIVHPLWETWSELVHPDAQKILDTLDDNREWYLSQIREEPVTISSQNDHSGDGAPQT
ncbi:hypothetical protein P879_00181 [Paragonimus westermani]|uniref:Phosphodiesterase n=1 Tax=Paragonimus westermani TaxID=34504 RepID=A0A8T0DV96_9TREM|nr:hypothetical protein P879_00181 [Paragonimus westermani]